MRILILKELLASVIEATAVMMFTSTEHAIIVTGNVQAIEQITGE
jgi:hypothetical protein